MKSFWDVVGMNGLKEGIKWWHSSSLCKESWYLHHGIPGSDTYDFRLGGPKRFSDNNMWSKARFLVIIHTILAPSLKKLGSTVKSSVIYPWEEQTLDIGPCTQILINYTHVYVSSSQLSEWKVMLRQWPINQNIRSSSLTLMLLVANLANTEWCKNLEKIIETLANGYSSESTQQELSNEFQHDRV